MPSWRRLIARAATKPGSERPPRRRRVHQVASPPVSRVAARPATTASSTGSTRSVDVGVAGLARRQLADQHRDRAPRPAPAGRRAAIRLLRLGRRTPVSCSDSETRSTRPTASTATASAATATPSPVGDGQPGQRAAAARAPATTAPARATRPIPKTAADRDREREQRQRARTGRATTSGAGRGRAARPGPARAAAGRRPPSAGAAAGRARPGPGRSRRARSRPRAVACWARVSVAIGGEVVDRVAASARRPRTGRRPAVEGGGRRLGRGDVGEREVGRDGQPPVDPDVPEPRPAGRRRPRAR